MWKFYKVVKRAKEMLGEVTLNFKPKIVERTREEPNRLPIDFELWAVGLHALGDAISCLSVVNIGGFSMMALRLQHIAVLFRCTLTKYS